MQTSSIRSWLFASALAVVAACSLINSGPASTVKDFYKAMERGKVTEATELLTGPWIQMMGKEKFKVGLAEMSERINNKGGIKSFEVESENVQGETASVDMVITYGNGTKEKDHSKLIKDEKGRWLIVVDQ